MLVRMSDEHAKQAPRALTVYFDGGCALCAREIAHYRRVAPSGAIHWLDADREQLPPELTREDALRYLRARDAAGRWHVGAHAFVAIWLQIPRYRWLGRSLRALGLTRLLDALYRRWADRRFRRLCAQGRCTLS